MDIYQEAGQRAWNAVLSRVRELNAEGKKQAEISRLLGHKGRASVSNWLKDKASAEKAGFPDMLRYMAALGLNPLDYIPQSPTIRRPAIYATAEKVQGNDLPKIPVIGATGAGDGVELFSAQPEYWLPVLPQYARADIIGLVVEGDSMEPTIHKGAVVGIVPYDGSINEGGIYLVQRPPFGSTIKRIKMGGDEQIVLHSDNPSYAPTPVPFEGYEKIILGRVVWIWQTC